MKRRTYKNSTSDQVIFTIMILSVILGFVYGIFTAEHTFGGFILSILSGILSFGIAAILIMFAGYFIFCFIKAILEIIRNFFNLLF